MTLDGYEGYLRALLRDGVQGQPVAVPAEPERADAAQHRRPADPPGQPDSSAYLVQNGPFATDTHLHPRPRRHHAALGSQDARGCCPRTSSMHSRFGVRPRLAARATTTSSRTTGRPSARSAYRPTSRTRPISASPSRPATCSRCAACRCPTWTRSSRATSTARRSSSTASSYELRVRPFPQGRNGIPNPAYDGGKGYRPVGAVSTYQVEEGGRCQGNNNCVPHLPGPGEVQRGQDAGQGAADRPRRHPGPDGRLPGRTSTRTPAGSASIEFKALPRSRLAASYTTCTVRGADLRARRERDRERPADAGLRAARARAG